MRTACIMQKKKSHTNFLQLTIRIQ